MLLIVCLVVFILNITAYFYWPHWILATLLALSALALVFVVYFFRDPVRVFTINDPNYLVAPADGTVVVIEPVMENEYFHEERLQVNIFMSPQSNHRRSPDCRCYGAAYSDLRSCRKGVPPQLAPRFHQVRLARRSVPAAQHRDVR